MRRVPGTMTTYAVQVIAWRRPRGVGCEAAGYAALALSTDLPYFPQPVSAAFRDHRHYVMHGAVRPGLVSGEESIDSVLLSDFKPRPIPIRQRTPPT